LNKLCREKWTGRACPEGWEEKWGLEVLGPPTELPRWQMPMGETEKKGKGEGGGNPPWGGGGGGGTTRAKGSLGKREFKTGKQGKVCPKFTPTGKWGGTVVFQPPGEEEKK